MSYLRPWLTALALLAMALVPTGFMPAMGAGGPALVLCPSYGPVPASAHDHDAMDHAAMGHSEEPATGADHFAKSKDCSIGSAAPAAVLPPAAIRIAEKSRRDEAFGSTRSSAILVPVRLRPPSRAPPPA